jgi:superfamily I DNA/RNA helicase
MPPKIIWSSWQKAIFNEIAVGTGNLIIIARAGSAKSSSIIEGCKHVPKGKSSIFIAFNKSTQEELRNKLPHSTEALTTHGLGLRTVRSKFPNVEINKDKTIHIIEKILPKNRKYLLDSVDKVASLCKATLTDSPSKIDALLDHYEVDVGKVERSTFIKYVIDTLRSSKEDTSSVNFDDMIWFPIIYGIKPPTSDFVFIDECQDLNISQIRLALQSVKHGGRVIAVLDNFQSIYSWRGADSEMLGRLKKQLKPKELKLPISYRCPKRVIYLAQKLVPDIQAWDQSPDGEIHHIHTAEMMNYVKPGCFVLSRTNAPLIKWCMTFIKRGIRSNILGKDIGDYLLWIIKKSGKKSPDQFMIWLDKWAEKETLDRKSRGRSTAYILDRVECFRELCYQTSSLDEVEANIRKMFGEPGDKNIVLFSSIHKSKGMERDDVFVLHDTLKNDSQEELNCSYIAFTRARKRLYLVSNNN